MTFARKIAARVAAVIKEGPQQIFTWPLIGLYYLFRPLFIALGVGKVWRWLQTTTLGQAYTLAQSAFFELEESDGLHEASEKVAKKIKILAFYNALDWALAWVFAIGITTMTALGYSAVEILLAGVLFDFFSALPFVYMGVRGYDMTLGSDFRRGFMAIKSHSPGLYRSVMVIATIRGAIWNGPEYVIMYFRQELHSWTRIILGLSALAVIQGMFWGLLWMQGYDSVAVPLWEYVLVPIGQAIGSLLPFIFSA